MNICEFYSSWSCTKGEAEYSTLMCSICASCQLWAAWHCTSLLPTLLLLRLAQPNVSAALCCWCGVCRVAGVSPACSSSS